MTDHSLCPCLGSAAQSLIRFAIVAIFQRVGFSFSSSLASYNQKYSNILSKPILMDLHLIPVSLNHVFFLYTVPLNPPTLPPVLCTYCTSGSLNPQFLFFKCTSGPLLLLFLWSSEPTVPLNPLFL